MMMCVGRAGLILLGGAVIGSHSLDEAWSLKEVHTYDGSYGDGGDFGFGVTDGNRVALVGDNYYCGEPYVTLLSPSLSTEASFESERGDLEAVAEDCLAVEHVALKGNHISFLYLNDEGVVVYDVREAWGTDEAFAWPGGEMPTQVEPGSTTNMFVALFRQDLTLVALDDAGDDDFKWTVDFATLGWDDVDSFTQMEGYVYVVGNVASNSDRAVAKINIGDGAVVWSKAVAVSSGTPKILITSTEVLLCSNAFFARIDAESGETLLSKVESDLWLTDAIAYDEVNGAIVSAGQSADGRALLRTSSSTTGEALVTLDWTEQFDAADPGSSRDEYPGDCDSDAVLETTCTVTSGQCAGYRSNNNCGTFTDDDDDESGVCCQADGGCCFVNFDEWAENQWLSKGAPVITGLLTTQNDDGPKLLVVGAYKGFQYDEDSYHFPFVAEFASNKICADSQTWSKKGDASKDCSWVAALPESRCLVKDDDAAFAFEQCKSACGDTCAGTCSDDPTWHKAGEPSKNCEWVKRYFNRCTVQGQDGTFGYESCSRSCQTCDFALPVVA